MAREKINTDSDPAFQNLQKWLFASETAYRSKRARTYPPLYLMSPSSLEHLIALYSLIHQASRAGHHAALHASVGMSSSSSSSCECDDPVTPSYSAATLYALFQPAADASDSDSSFVHVVNDAYTNAGIVEIGEDEFVDEDLVDNTLESGDIVGMVRFTAIAADDPSVLYDAFGDISNHVGRVYGIVDTDLLATVRSAVPALCADTFLVDIKVDADGNVTLVKQYTAEQVSFVAMAGTNDDTFNEDGLVVVEAE